MGKYFRVVLPLLALVLAGAGCVSFGGTNVGAQADGGIFVTANKGDVWQQKVAIPTTDGSRRSISGTAISFISQDPQDPSAVYIGTAENGLFYSLDGGNSWLQPAQINRGRVRSVAVHPKDRCVVYVTFENKLFKSTDCLRTWNIVYIDSQPDKLTKFVTVDSYNPNNIMLATSSGALLKSTDDGASWSVARSFNDDIMKIASLANDSRRLIVATKVSGLWRTDDGGDNWVDISLGYANYGGAKEFSDFSLGVSDPLVVVMASKFGLLRSNDAGSTWQPLELLGQPGSTSIYSVAVDPKDPNSIYYGTSTTFIRTSNGGANWTPKKLPTTRAATALLVDAANSNVVYLGVTKFK